jgi:segregation and condensation protein A
MKEASSPLEKPFWLREPWSILFNLEGLEKREVWSIDLRSLLASFLEELRRLPYVNFAIPGTALLSSTILHRIKSELVLRLEEPPRPPPPETQGVTEEGPIPIIPLPIRHEYGSLTIEEILKAIREILTLKPEASIKGDSSPSPLQAMAIPTELPSLDPYLVKIEELTERLYERLLELFKQDALIPYSKVVGKLPRREALITFLALLFLACRGKLNLWQEEEPGEIYISLPGGRF